MIHVGRVIVLLASRMVLPVLAIASVGGAFLMVAIPDDGVRHGELDPEREEFWKLCIKCNAERDRLRKELWKAEQTGRPEDLAAMATYDAIRDEYFERVQAGRVEAYYWYLEQVEGRSIYELRPAGSEPPVSKKVIPPE